MFSSKIRFGLKGRSPIRRGTCLCRACCRTAFCCRLAPGKGGRAMPSVSKTRLRFQRSTPARCRSLTHAEHLVVSLLLGFKSPPVNPISRLAQEIFLFRRASGARQKLSRCVCAEWAPCVPGRFRNFPPLVSQGQMTPFGLSFRYPAQSALCFLGNLREGLYTPSLSWNQKR